MSNATTPKQRISQNTCYNIEFRLPNVPHIHDCLPVIVILIVAQCDRYGLVVYTLIMVDVVADFNVFFGWRAKSFINPCRKFLQ